MKDKGVDRYKICAFFYDKILYIGYNSIGKIYSANYNER